MNNELEVKEVNDTPIDSGEIESPEVVDVDLSHIQKFLFGKGEVTKAEQDKMAFIWDFMSKQASGPGETLGLISDLERSLNAPGDMGRLDNIFSYIKLMSQSRDIESELRAYRR